VAERQGSVEISEGVLEVGGRSRRQQARAADGLAFGGSLTADTIAGVTAEQEKVARNG
jgi:hypothetical protein